MINSTGMIVYSEQSTTVGYPDNQSGMPVGLIFELGHDCVMIEFGAVGGKMGRSVMVPYLEFIEMAAAIVAKKEEIDAGTTA